MKTQGEIEAAICQGMSRFEQEYMGRGPKDIRTHLIETARPLMEAMIREITGIKVISLHHDISTTTGEEVVLFTLAESPQVRDVKKKSNS